MLAVLYTKNDMSQMALRKCRELYKRLLSSPQIMKTQEARLLIETVLRTADVPGGHTSLQRNNT
jgi:hypothetical protein